MSRRWTEEEELALAEVRRRLKDLIDQQPPFPEGISYTNTYKRFIFSKSYASIFDLI